MQAQDDSVIICKGVPQGANISLSDLASVERARIVGKDTEDTEASAVATVVGSGFLFSVFTLLL